MNKLKLPDSMYARLVAVAVSGAVLIGVGYAVGGKLPAAPQKGSHRVFAESVAAGPAPQKVVESDDAGALATYTIGARTVLLRGQPRTFSNPVATNAKVATTARVVLAPTPFTGTIDRTWQTQALAQGAAPDPSQAPDILATAMQYLPSALSIIDPNGQVIAGNASYGPLKSDGTRQDGADFNDFLGVPYMYGATQDPPDPALYGSLDSAGFQRTVWGFRSGLPLEISPTGTAIPRLAHDILQTAPGVVVIASNRKQVTDLSRLQAGDLVFFDLNAADGSRVDHVGMYIGVDNKGHHRFISSRQTADGPTFGDIGGPSILDGNGRYAKAFRAAKRF